MTHQKLNLLSNLRIYILFYENGSQLIIITARKKFCLNSTKNSTWVSCSVQFSHSVMSNSLQTHGLQHARLLCPSPTLGVYSKSCPLRWWCHPTISFSVVPFSSRLQSFQHQGLFQWVSPSHQVAKVLELQLQHQSFQWIFMTDFL